MFYYLIVDLRGLGNIDCERGRPLVFFRTYVELGMEKFSVVVNLVV